MTRVPNADKAIVDPAKVTHYLLNKDHELGKSKANFFLSLGFTTNDVSIFSSALVDYARMRPVIDTVPSEYGTKYVTECNIQAPDGSNPCIIVVWMMNDQNIPRLITALPYKPG